MTSNLELRFNIMLQQEIERRAEAMRDQLETGVIQDRYNFHVGYLRALRDMQEDADKIRRIITEGE